MKYEFTNKELKDLMKLKEDLIISLFDCNDKRYALERAIKEAYLMGKNS